MTVPEERLVEDRDLAISFATMSYALLVLGKVTGALDNVLCGELELTGVTGESHTRIEALLLAAKNDGHTLVATMATELLRCVHHTFELEEWLQNKLIAEVTEAFPELRGESVQIRRDGAEVSVILEKQVH